MTVKFLTYSTSVAAIAGKASSSEEFVRGVTRQC